jgi:N-acetylmuramoyl-L-alanine amidase
MTPTHTPPRPPRCAQPACLQAGTLVLLLGTQHIARGATILAVRMWPAPDYSRVTIESDGQAECAKQIFVTSPPRLAVDIEGIDLNPALRELVAKVKPDDPNITGIRVGQERARRGAPGAGFEAGRVQPQVFTLPPGGGLPAPAGVRPVPGPAADPLEALIAERLRDTTRQRRPQPRPPRPRTAPAKPSTPADPLGELIAQHATANRAASATATPAAPTPAAPPWRPTAQGAVATAPDRPPHHHGAGPRPRRRRPRRHRPRGTREKDVVLQIAHRCATASTPPRGRQPHARLSHPRRRLFRAPARARAKSAARAGRPVRQHPRRCLHAPPRAVPACSR